MTLRRTTHQAPPGSIQRAVLPWRKSAKGLEDQGVSTEYRVRCERRGGEHRGSDDRNAQSGFTTTGPFDASADGVVVRSAFWAIAGTSGRLTPLVDPVDVPVLRRSGLSYSPAGGNGRLVEVRRWICADCGTVYQHADLVVASPGAGWLVVIGAVLVAALLGHVPPAVAGLVSVALVIWLILFRVVGRTLLRLFHPATRPWRAGGPCPVCGSRSRVAPHAVGSRRLPCPRCHSRSVSVIAAGTPSPEPRDQH